MCFTNSFLTTDAGDELYFYDGVGGFVYHTIPEGAYTGGVLAAAIQAATGRHTTYDTLTNQITPTLAGAAQPWLRDSVLATFDSGWPAGASKENPRSLNAVLGDGVNTATTVVWSFVRMCPCSYAFCEARSSDVQTTMGRGTHTTFYARFLS